ncbi:MAG: hypothetical protein HQM06_13580 [Magnetococcales bacterium]|nr:hypothetical protein [Magnetococcales bacterium]
MKKQKAHPNPFATASDSATSAARPTKSAPSLSKAAKVEEQLFQDHLAVSLEQEQPVKAKRASTKKSAKLAAARIAQTTSNIVDEFESMIDSMLPTVKQEKAACQHAITEKKATANKKKPDPKKSSGKKR